MTLSSRAMAAVTRLSSIAIVDLAHTKPPTDALALDDDVYRNCQHFANVAAFEIPATFRFLDQQRQLLEGKACGIGVHGRDRTGMARVEIANIIEGRSVP